MSSFKVCSLNRTSGFFRNLKIFEENKHRDWNEWLTIKKFFKSGVQGIVGLFALKEDERITFVFKVSKHINYLVEHELAVMTALRPLADFCPHFCRVYGKCELSVNPKLKKGNVFDLSTSSMPIKKTVLF